MAAEFSVVTSPVLNVTVSSTVSSFSSERRFPKELTIYALKGKLELVTGASVAGMRLEAYSRENELVCALDDDDAMLGSYQIDDGMRIHVIDTLNRVGIFDDTSTVEKYEISNASYENRADSIREFKKKMKIGQFKEVDPEEAKRIEEEKKKKEEQDERLAAEIKVGTRCEVTAERKPAKRGEVMYVGLVEFKPGFWVGVKYDEPLGLNDGSVKGKRYFECSPKYGGFMKPSAVTVGDFPELGIDDELEM